MGFKEVASLDADVTIALGKKDKATGKPYPKQAEGYYLGSRTVENKRGESQLHFLQTAKGNLGIWGTTDLNRKIKQVPAGTMVRITSTGTKLTPNGDMYTYKVESDLENTIDVGDLVSASAPAEDDTYDDADTGERYDANDDATDEDAAQTAALAAAERKAKVLATLNKGKSAKG